MTRETPIGLKFGDEELEGVLVDRRDSRVRLDSLDRKAH